MRNNALSLFKALPANTTPAFEAATVLAVGNGTVDVRMADGTIYRHIPLGGGATVGGSINVQFVAGVPQAWGFGGGSGSGAGGLVVSGSGGTLTGSIIAGDGLTGGGALGAGTLTIDVGQGDGISVSSSAVAVDSTVVRTSRTITAGDGLTGGGALSADRTLNVAVANTGATGLTVEADAVRLTSSSNPGAAAAILASDSSGHLALTKLRTPLIDTASGALVLTPSTGVTLTDGKTFNGSGTFVSGFAGSGWRLDQGVSYGSQSTLEVDNVIVRGLMRVYELVINKIRVSRGSIIISPGGGKVSAVSGSGPYTLTFDDDHGLATNDLLRAQKFTGSGTYQSLLTVTGVPTSSTATVTLSSGSAPAIGYEYAVIGNTSDANRQGGLFLTADDSGAPFMDIYDGVAAHSDFNSYTKTKARLGKLTGITDSFFGTLSDYGLYTSRAYLNGAYINGSLIIGPGVGFTVAPLLYCAYDTPQNSSSVNTNGHLGQVGAPYGGVSGGRGKFAGGALAIGETSTNLITNPRFAAGTYSTGYITGGNASISQSTDAYLGSVAMGVVFSGTGNRYINNSITRTNTVSDLSAHAWVKCTNGTAQLAIAISRDDFGYAIAGNTVSVGSEWTRITVNASGSTLNTTSFTTSVRILILNDADGGSTKNVAIGFVQAEELTYNTPDIDGSMGSGFTWAGTAHASLSTRSASTVSYGMAGNIPATGSVSAWIYPGLKSGGANNYCTVFHSSSAPYYFIVRVSPADNLDVFWGSSSSSVLAGTVTRNAWNHIAVTFDGSTVRAYLNGVLIGTGSGGTPTLATLSVGSYVNSDQWFNGYIDDLAIMNRVLTADEVTAIYRSNAPLNVTRSNYELVLADPSTSAKVVANAYGIFGTDASAKPTFSLINVASTVNGESLTSGDVMMGDNSTSKANVLFDQSAGQLLFRGGTTTRALIGTTGDFVTRGQSFKIHDSTGASEYGHIDGVTSYFIPGSVAGVRVVSDSMSSGAVEIQASGTGGSEVAGISLAGGAEYSRVEIYTNGLLYQFDETQFTSIRDIQSNATIKGTHLDINGGSFTVTSGAGTFSNALTTSAGVRVPRSSGSAVFAMDAGTTGSAITLADNATSTPFGNANNFSGLVLIAETANNGMAALFLCGAGTTVLISESTAGFYSATASTASKANLYYSSSVLTLENKQGGSRTFNVMAIRIRDAT